MREQLDEVDAAPSPRSIRPRSVISQQCSNIRTLRRYSSSRSRDGFSNASASGVVDRAPAALHHQVREGEVVPEARIDVDVVLAAHGVDRAVAARDRAEPRTRSRAARARSASTRPRGSSRPRARSAARPQTYATSGSAKLRTSLRSASGAQRRVRVGEGEDLAVGLAHREVLRRRPCRRAGTAGGGRAARARRSPRRARRSGRSRRRRRRRSRAARPGSRARAGSRAGARSRPPRRARRRSG